jgi:hypothetical protein
VEPAIPICFEPLECTAQQSAPDGSRPGRFHAPIGKLGRIRLALYIDATGKPSVDRLKMRVCLMRHVQQN